MRKALIITMLLLMIMTSLNAGTLAIYTSTVELKAVPIAAKRFVLDVGRGSADEFDLWIAPGDTVSYYFTISNSAGEGRQSEVDMDLVIEADFSSVYQALPGILISLTGADLQVGAADGRLSYSESKAFTASVPKEKMYSLVFSWPDSEAARQSIMSGRSILPLSIYIRGTQHV